MPFAITPLQPAPSAATGRMGRFLQIRVNGADLGDDRADVLDIVAPAQPLPDVPVPVDHYLSTRLTLREIGMSGAVLGETDSPTAVPLSQGSVTHARMTSLIDDRPGAAPTLGLGAVQPGNAMPVDLAMAVGSVRTTAGLPESTTVDWQEKSYTLTPSSAYDVTLDDALTYLLQDTTTPYGSGIIIQPTEGTEILSIAKRAIGNGRPCRRVEVKFKVGLAPVYKDDAPWLNLYDDADQVVVYLNPRRESATTTSENRMELRVGAWVNYLNLVALDDVWYQFVLDIDESTGDWTVEVWQAENPTGERASAAGNLPGGPPVIAAVAFVADANQRPLGTYLTPVTTYADMVLEEAWYRHDLDLYCPAKPTWSLWMIEDGRVSGPEAGAATFHVGEALEIGWRFRITWPAWTGDAYPTISVQRLADVGPPPPNEHFLRATRGWGATGDVVTIGMI